MKRIADAGGPANRPAPLAGLWRRLARALAALVDPAAPSPRRARRLVVIDPGLRGGTGHHLAYDLALAAQARRVGLAFRLLGNAQLDVSALPEDLAVEGVFPRTPYSPVDPAADPETGSRGKSREFRRQLAAALADLGPHDVVLLHSLNAAMTVGAAAWIAEEAGRSGARFILFLVLPDHRRGSRRQACYRRAFRRLSGLAPGRVRLLAHDAELAREFEALSGGRPRVELAPFMKVTSPLPSAPADGRGDGEVPLVGFVGGSRPERGVTLLPAIVEEFRARHGAGARFLVQLDATALGRLENVSPGFRAAAASMAAMPGVTVVEGPLSRGVYEAQLAALDVVLLPYLPSAAARGSGVLYEAVALGKPVVLPAGTHLARDAAAVGAAAVTFAEARAELVASALAETLRRLPELGERARTAAHRFRAERDLGAFFDALVADPGEPAR